MAFIGFLRVFSGFLVTFIGFLRVFSGLLTKQVPFRGWLPTFGTTAKSHQRVSLTGHKFENEHEASL